jgi:hypothetical protein
MTSGRYGRGVGVLGPVLDQRASIAVRICRTVSPLAVITAVSSVIETHVPQLSPCRSIVIQPFSPRARTKQS